MAFLGIRHFLNRFKTPLAAPPGALVRNLMDNVMIYGTDDYLYILVRGHWVKERQLLLYESQDRRMKMEFQDAGHTPSRPSEAPRTTKEFAILAEYGCPTGDCPHRTQMECFDALCTSIIDLHEMVNPG